MPNLILVAGDERRTGETTMLVEESVEIEKSRFDVHLTFVLRGVVVALKVIEEPRHKRTESAPAISIKRLMPVTFMVSFETQPPGFVAVRM